MKLHLRFDGDNDQHAKITLFIDGASCGGLIMSPAQAIWFHHILDKGTKALSPDGLVPIKFISSGMPPQPSGESITEALHQKATSGPPLPSPSAPPVSERHAAWTAIASTLEAMAASGVEPDRMAIAVQNAIATFGPCPDELGSRIRKVFEGAEPAAFSAGDMRNPGA